MEYFLKLTVLEAHLTRDVETFGKMDPFIVLTHNKQTQTSKTLNDAGKNPKWNEDFSFVVLPDETIDFSVYDAESSNKDQLVGANTLSVQFLIDSIQMNITKDIWFESKKCGDVVFSYELQQSDKQMYLDQLQKNRAEKEQLSKEKSSLEKEIVAKTNLWQAAKSDYQKECEKVAELEKQLKLKNTSELKGNSEEQNQRLIEKKNAEDTIKKIEAEKKGLLADLEKKNKEIQTLNEKSHVKVSAVEKNEGLTKAVIGFAVGAVLSFILNKALLKK